jgi:hypothetical protein
MLMRMVSLVGVALCAAQRTSPTAQPPSPTPMPTMTPIVGTEVASLWERFITSSGFGGLMAVIAAGIGAFLAVRQLNHQKAKAREDRWWDTLTWVYDRTIVERDKKDALPQHVAFSMLRALNYQIQGSEKKVEGETIASILEMFEGTDPVPEPDLKARAGGFEGFDRESQVLAEDSPDGENLIPVPDRGAAILLDELRAEVSSKGYSVVAEHAFDAGVYEGNALDELEQVVSSCGLSGSRVMTKRGMLYRVHSGQRLLMIQAKYFRRARFDYSSMFRIADAHRGQLRVFKQYEDRSGYEMLFMSNAEPTMVFRKKMELNGMHIVRWSGKQDNEQLKIVLERIFSIGDR